MVLDWKDIAKFKSEEELENFLMSKSIKISKKKITTINCKYCPSSYDTNDDSLIFCRANLRYLVCRCSSGCKMRYQTRICKNSAILRVLNDNNTHDFHTNSNKVEIKSSCEKIINDNTVVRTDGLIIFLTTILQSFLLLFVIFICISILLKTLFNLK
jgi:hypothetical protein